MVQQACITRYESAGVLQFECLRDPYRPYRQSYIFRCWTGSLQLCETALADLRLYSPLCLRMCNDWTDCSITLLWSEKLACFRFCIALCTLNCNRAECQQILKGLEQALAEIDASRAEPARSTFFQEAHAFLHQH